MLEKDLAKEFNDLFKEYQIWTPSNRTGGWPDKGVQINNSRMIWFELKIIEYRLGSPTFKVSELTADQAAWLAKWQRSGGFCFLFLGFVDYNNNITKYGILRCGNWNTWLGVPKHAIRIDQLVHFTEDKYDIYKWFKDLFVPQSTRANSDKNGIET
jgi:hypothetical protein